MSIILDLIKNYCFNLFSPGSNNESSEGNIIYTPDADDDFDEEDPDEDLVI